MLDYGKRRISRLRVALPAKAIFLEGEFRVALHDLSQHGARIGHDNLPQLRGDVLLSWCGFESFGRVVWSKPALCGIAFYDAIPNDWVLLTRNLDASGEVPGEAEVTRLHARAFVAGQVRH